MGSRSLFRAVLAALIFVCSGTAAAAQGLNSASVATLYGPLHGFRNAAGIHFFGIPYAKPPLGRLRWMPPQPPQSWSEVREAVYFGPACMQRPDKVKPKPMSEDCLTLNVSVPLTAEAGSRLPVLVRIHGGGYVGSSGANEHIASPWTRNGVILVTLNYRLGVLGFFDHPAINHGLGANFGLMDIQAALAWVQANIASFGGDPARVTIAGVSAGGEAVQLLQVMPGSSGLFARGIASSGYAAWPLPVAEGVPVPGAEIFADATALSRERAVAAGAKQESVGTLRALPAAALVEAVQGFVTPIVDGVTLPDQPMRLYRARFGGVPLLTGANSFDGSVYPGAGVTPEALLAMLGPHEQKILGLYAKDFAVSRERGIKRLFGDLRYALSGALVAAETAHAAPAWLYYFDAAPEGQPGAFHGSEEGFLNHDGPGEPGATMRAYWLNFIKTGNPNGKGADGQALPLWREAGPEHRNWMVLDAAPHEGDVLRNKLKALEVTLAK